MFNTILYRMAAGIPGDVGRREHCTIEPVIMNTATPPTAYGQPVKLVSGQLEPIATGDTLASVIYGFLVRPYPTNGSQQSVPLGTAVSPNPYDIGNVLKRGYMSALVTSGGATAPTSIAKGAAVYICTTTGGGRTAGDIEAGSNGSGGGANSVLSTAYFMGPADSAGNVEIGWNI
jgi:hypothetical protein